MTNDEKREFLIEAHKLYMEERPYDNCRNFTEIKRNDDRFREIYITKFKDRLPKKLYKYRKINKCSLDCLENGTAWFTNPKDFDDTLDSTINNDIEKEKRELETNYKDICLILSKKIAAAICEQNGFSVNHDYIDLAFSCFNENGEIDEEEIKTKLDKCLSEEEIEQLKNIAKEVNLKSQDEIVSCCFNGFLDCYLEENKRCKENLFVLSLAEENDNQAMWGLYADESRGFCIEYEFPLEDFLAQKMLSNLFPIYYGNREHIKFIDLLIDGIVSKNSSEGISYEDYRNIFLSMLTKDPNYSMQKEWRIVFDNVITQNKNLQNFPFATSIILGERISDENAFKLIEIAKDKGLSVFRRKLNSSESGIIVEKIL